MRDIEKVEKNWAGGRMHRGRSMEKHKGHVGTK